MIHDLVGAGQIRATADVLVIGAGTVGLVLAIELAARGQRVICLESGGREQKGETHPLNAVEQSGTPYAGAEFGRARCLGGTSTLWGGALIPFQAADLSSAAWPLDWQELAPHVPKVEALFGLSSGPYEDPDIAIGPNHVARLAKWPAFKKRNVYSLLRNKAEAATGPQIWINATATQFAMEGDRLTGTVAEAADGSTICVTAREVVISAGAIESTRLLLLLAQQNPGALTGRALGEGFHDHLSAVVAELDVRDGAALNKLVSFRFDSTGGMRNLRFELAPASGLRHAILPCFAHVGFSETQGGFSALRDVFRAAQRRQMPALAVLAKLGIGLPWLLRAVWWRFVYRRLLFPAAARIELHMVIEQASVPENRISLSSNERDPFGQARSHIAWAVRDADLKSMAAAVDAFEQAWNGGGFARLAALRRRSPQDVTADIIKGGGIYHPGGSTRMAASPDHGPVGPDLRVYGAKNLAVCATSVLPSGGGANPTMMVLLLAMRYAEAVDELKR